MFPFGFEQRKTEERNFWFTFLPRPLPALLLAPFLAWSLTVVPRKPHRTAPCYAKNHAVNHLPLERGLAVQT